MKNWLYLTSAFAVGITLSVIVLFLLREIWEKIRIKKNNNRQKMTKTFQL
jgi:hypothetical protein